METGSAEQSQNFGLVCMPKFPTNEDELGGMQVITEESCELRQSHKEDVHHGPCLISMSKTGRATASGTTVESE